MSSGLYYKTGEEVRLGDVIRVRRLFAQARTGTVCYTPGLSPRHRYLEYVDVRQWAYRTADGTVYAAGYDPARMPVLRGITLVARGPEVSLSPTEGLE